MDGNSKEEFCTMCSVEVPSAFATDNNEEEDVKKVNCTKWSKWILNILVWAIIIIFIYFLFKKP